LAVSCVIGIIFLILPAGPVAKYCHEYVCECVCLSVWPRGYLKKHMRDLYQF